MGEPLAAVGAMLYSSDLTEIGRVTRSTESSAWVGGQRFVYAYNGTLRRNGDKYGGSILIEGSGPHKQAEEAVAFRARMEASEKEHDKALRRMFSRIGGIMRGGQESDKAPRIATVESAVMAALDALEVANG